MRQILLEFWENNMGHQLIFCVETNQNSNTDWIYIKELIDYYYIITNEISLKQVYMGTKSKYKSNKVKNDIARKIKQFSGDTTVIYCIDTDEINSKPKDLKDFNEINEFCDKNGYRLIWFCENVEDAFWGQKVADSDKVKKAAEFRRKKQIAKCDIIKLANLNQCNAKTSNILSVLDEIILQKSNR